MWVECQGDGRNPELVGPTPHQIDDLGVATVDPIEIAERQNRPVPGRRCPVLGKVNDLGPGRFVGIVRHR